MLHKIDNKLRFDSKRNRNIITPCCNKKNTNGKFVTYKGYPEHYGYCHSCGTSNLPPTLYRDDNGEEFIWNETLNKFEKSVLQLYDNDVLQSCNTNSKLCDNAVTQSSAKIEYIDFNIVRRYCDFKYENNLLTYLRNTFSKSAVDRAKEMYHIGTNKKLWTVFWMINKDGKTQKAKLVLYAMNGKRTNYFKVPYKNEDGYYSCLYGEHLLRDDKKPIVLVESEKTAIICSIVLPNYTWLAYGGINGLTDSKLKVLSGESIIIIPDMSNNAVDIVKGKISRMEELNIKAKIFDMTDNKTDEELKKEGLYNNDIEDVVREYFEALPKNQPI